MQHFLFIFVSFFEQKISYGILRQYSFCISRTIQLSKNYFDFCEFYLQISKLVLIVILLPDCFVFLHYIYLFIYLFFSAIHTK